MSQLTQRLSQLSPELRTQLMGRINGRVTSSSFQVIPSVVRSRASFPLSFAQQRLWFIEQVEPGNAAYNIATAIHLKGEFSVALLEQSFIYLLQRHESLRTTFHLCEGQPVQVIQPVSTFEIPLVDLRSLPANERIPMSEEVMRQEAQTPFSLEKGPLLRARLCQLGERDFILMFTMHHIIADGWSMSILVQEVTTIYGYLLQGQEPLLPELPIQYVDYALWQRNWLQGEVLQKQLEYWKERLSDAPVLELPTDYPRPAQRSYRGALYTFTLPQKLVWALRHLSQQEHATLTMTLLAGFGILLARYSNQTDLVVGMPIANRTRTEFERLIGLFVNSLALRLDLSGDPDFLQMLHRVRETLLSADAHQDIPFEKLVQELQPQRSLSHAPFFQVMFIPQNQPSASPGAPGLQVQSLRPDRQAAMFDLSLYIFEQEQGVEVCAEYNTDLFAEATIARMLHHYANILTESVANPHTNIWQLSLLSKHEQQRLLVDWNATERSFATRPCLHQCVEAMVEKDPKAVAVVFENNHCLTYGELERRSNQLAHYLQRCGVQPGCLVGILLERSLDMVISLLGVLKAGGAYVPLDPEYPMERLAYIVQDSGLQILLTQEGLQERVSSHPALEIICLERDRVALEQEESGRPICEVTEKDLAYVIYTSGSTGKPKGVQIPHAAVVNFLCSMREQPGMEANDVLLAVTTISFDIAALEIFLPLTTGACVFLLSRESVLDGRSLGSFIERSGATIMQATPATWRLLVEAGWQGKPDLKILCGGEALSSDLAGQLLERGAGAWNLYGPTETTIWSTLFQIETIEGPVSIGRPIANTQVYVLDAFLSPVPVGVAGDIYIGGAGVARGYRNRPALTAERFIPDPFHPDPERRLYKTGDRGCYRPDGTLLYLGRADQQIKLRGFRIEPGEIETVLTGHPDVQAAIVLVREDTPGNQRLVGYIRPRTTKKVDKAEMRTWLKRYLPDYMIPSAFVVLDAFPFTPNGKIDRRALPAPEIITVDEELEAPRNDIERVIATFWLQLLELKEVGIRQNFFDLGGHSLIAPQLISSINQAFQIELPLRALFAAPTIAELAQTIIDLRAGASSTWLAPVDLPSEVVLDADIYPGQPVKPRTTPLTKVFLTGATGFLGVHLLSEILQQTQATIYCLIRASSHIEGKKRLQECLLAHRLWNATYADRIVPVCGDLTRPLLGLSAQEFTFLAEEVEGIYHCGAWVNFIYPYQELKASNVLGTQEVLRLACQAEAPVHFISTAGVFALNDYPAQTRFTERTPLADTPGLDEGYAQSKWVAEKLVTLARSRGAAANIYRPGIISGHSQTGIGNTTDLVWTLLKGCIQLGSAPDLEWPINLAPVDYVSKAITYLSFQPECVGETFHLANPQTIHWNSLVRWTAARGYSLRRLSFERWREEMCSELRKPSTENALKPFHTLLEGLDGEALAGRQVFFEARQTQARLTDAAIICPDMDERLLQAYLSHFVQCGFLPAAF